MSDPRLQSERPCLEGMFTRSACTVAEAEPGDGGPIEEVEGGDWFHGHISQEMGALGAASYVKSDWHSLG